MLPVAVADRRSAFTLSPYPSSPRTARLFVPSSVAALTSIGLSHWPPSPEPQQPVSPLASDSLVAAERHESQSRSSPEPARPWRYHSSAVSQLISCRCDGSALGLSARLTAADLAGRFLPSVSSSATLRYWTAALDATSAASTSYTACIRSAGRSCDVLYNRSIAQLTSEQAADIASNNRIAAAAASNSAHCQTVAASAQSVAQAWLAAGAVLQYNEDVCSADDISRTRLLLGDRSSESASGSSASASFAANSSAILAAASVNVANRFTYDLSYMMTKGKALSLHVSLLAALVDPFPAVTLSASLSALDEPVFAVLQCVWGGSGSSLCNASLASLYQPVLDTLQVSLAAAQDGFASLLGQALSFSSTALSELAAAASFVDYLRGFTSLLSSIGVSVALPSLPPIAPFSFVGDLSLEESVAVIDRAADSFARLMSPAAAAFQSAVDAVRSDAVTEAELLVARIGNLTVDLPGLFADFDPPPVDLQVAAFDLQLDQAADSFVAQARATFASLAAPSFNASVQLSLDGLLEDDVSSCSNESCTTTASTLLSNLTTAVTRSNFSLSLLPFSGSFPVDSVIDACGGLVAAFLLLDYAFRGYRTVHIVVNAVKRPSISLPPVDTRLHADTTRAPSDLLAYVVTHPLALYASAGVVIALSLYPLAVLYSILYAQYVAGCVQSSNGTLLTVNANALLFNAAGLEGHAVLLATVAAYDARAAVDCGRLNAHAVASYMNDEAAVAQARQQQLAADQHIALMSRCLSPASFELSLLPPTASNGSSPSLPSPFVVLSAGAVTGCASTADSSGGVVLPTVNCSALPSCSLSACAGGPSPASISAATFNSGCASEYFIHSSLLLYAVALLVFACHNASRVLVVRALARMCWRSLTPQLTALVQPGEDGLLDEQSRDRLQWGVKDAVALFRRQTLLLFVCGLLAHLPYVVVLGLLVFVDKGIEPPQIQ